MWAERERPICRSALKPIFVTSALRSPCFLPAPLHFRSAQRCADMHWLLVALDLLWHCGLESTSKQWCGLRPSVLGQDRSETKKIGLGLGLGLGMQVWCCVVKQGLVTHVVTMILKDTATFQVLFIVSLLCAWNIITVEINSAFTYLKLNPPSAFVYFRWSWSWSCKQRSWFWLWSCYFGLGLKNLVLFTSLVESLSERLAYMNDSKLHKSKDSFM